MKQRSLIVRIYRKGPDDDHGAPEIIHGTVENIHTLQTQSFSNKDELWHLINYGSREVTSHGTD